MISVYFFHIAQWVLRGWLRASPFILVIDSVKNMLSLDYKYVQLTLLSSFRSASIFMTISYEKIIYSILPSVISPTKTIQSIAEILSNVQARVPDSSLSGRIRNFYYQYYSVKLWQCLYDYLFMCGALGI